MITVVIPFYNSEAYLKRAIDSCLAQKEVTQIVLVDDCSTDNSHAIAQDFVKSSAGVSIDVFKTVENIGPGLCRNMALELSTNEFISCLDSDDYYLEDRFGKALEVFNNDLSIDGVYSPFKQKLEEPNLQFAKENFELDLNDGKQIRLEDFLLGNKGIVAHWGIVFRKSFLLKENIKYSDDRNGEDIDYLFDSIIKGKIVYAEGIVGIRSITGNNLTNKAVGKELYRVHKRWFNNMLKGSFSKELNYFFLKNFVRKHPFFLNRNGFIGKCMKGVYLFFVILVSPKLWFKLI